MIYLLIRFLGDCSELKKYLLLYCLHETVQNQINFSFITVKLEEYVSNIEN